MKILVWLKDTSEPLAFDVSENAYLKQEMYCILQGDDVIKIPIQNILFVKEKYGEHLRSKRIKTFKDALKNGDK